MASSARPRPQRGQYWSRYNTPGRLSFPAVFFGRGRGCLGKALPLPSYWLNLVLPPEDVDLDPSTQVGPGRPFYPLQTWWSGSGVGRKIKDSSPGFFCSLPVAWIGVPGLNFQPRGQLAENASQSDSQILYLPGSPWGEFSGSNNTQDAGLARGAGSRDKEEDGGTADGRTLISI